MDLFLQFWGGGFYLLNKVFFSLAEGRQELLKRKLRILGWSVYLLGVPAWGVILLGKHDWIAASIEIGGIPAMMFGLYNVYRTDLRPSRSLDRVVSGITYSFLVFGVCFSLYDYGGLTTVSQLLEMGVMVGFLLGSYLLAKQKISGWVFFMLMNGSMATLMLIQSQPLLSIQQLVSLCFVLYGFSTALRTSRT